MIEQLNTISSEQASIAIRELDQAIENHRIWYVQLHEGLLCKQPFLETITHPHAHTKCQLGCWFYEKESDIIRQHPEFKRLGSVHMVMHDEARKLVEFWQKSNEVKLDNYRILLDQQHKCMELLVCLRDEMVHMQQSFDPLTELINRRYMGVILEKSHTSSSRNGQPFVIAMLDLDYFKSINDSYGHLAGDEVLKVVSKCLSSSLRNSDYVSRYGGEEFLIMLPNSTLDTSFEVLERVREEISQLIIQFDNTEIKVTISIGMSNFEVGKSIEEIIRQADEALYTAKSKGRNQLFAYNPPLQRLDLRPK